MRLYRCLLFLFSVIVLALPALAEEQASFSISVTAPITTLPFRVIDAEFSTQLNSIVAVATSPNQLHIYNPDSGALTSVNLPVLPNCVGVSPDGLTAVVGHDAWISQIDLVEHRVLQTIAIPTNVADIVLGPNGYAYAFTPNSYSSYTYSINLSTGVQSQSYGSRNPAAARLHPSFDRIYGADRYISPDDIIRINIGDGIASYWGDSVYHGDYAMCGNVWISADGVRLFTACGNTFWSTSNTATDMRYAGKLSQEGRIQWVAHSAETSNVVVLPAYLQYGGGTRVDNEIHYYTPDFLVYRGKAILPSFQVQNNTWAPRGRWIFFNADGTKQYVIVQADENANLTADYGVVTIDCSNASVSLTPSTITIPATASSVQFSVTGVGGCGWKAVSNATWIDTLSTGVGDGSVTFTASANATAVSRTATITVGNALFTVTQNAPLPASVVAASQSSTSIALTWSATGPVDHYEIWRSSGGAFSMVGTAASTSFADTTAEPDAAYVYKIRSVVTGGGTTDFGAPDYAHTYTLTDSQLTAGLFIKAAHVTELRAVANALRAAAGLTAATFSDPSLGGVVIKRIHVVELRESINAVRATLGLPATGFAAISTGDTVQAQTFTDLRSIMR